MDSQSYLSNYGPNYLCHYAMLESSPALAFFSIFLTIFLYINICKYINLTKISCESYSTLDFTSRNPSRDLPIQLDLEICSFFFVLSTRNKRMPGMDNVLWVDVA